MRPVPFCAALLWLLLFLLFPPAAALAQQVVAGQVTDAATQQPLPYVSIGLPGRNAGTVADENGRFQLQLRPEHEQYSLRFSLIGYQPVSMPVRTWREQAAAGRQAVALQPEQTLLPQVEVKAHLYRKQKLLGSRSGLESIGFYSNELGSELGRQFTFPATPAYLQEASFRIARSAYDTLVFRLNVYQLQDGRPGRNLLRQQILVRTTTREGLVTVDLRPYHLVLRQNVVLSLEWFKDLGPTAELELGATMQTNGHTFYRKTSQGEWGNVVMADLGLQLLVAYPDNKRKLEAR